MSEFGDDMREWRKRKSAHRQSYTVECPRCPPNRSPSKLIPGQTCRVDGYTDPRPQGWKP